MSTVEWLMMGAFIAGLGLSGWKVYAFIPSKPLADDDTTPESIATLEKLMLVSNNDGLTEEELFDKILTHPDFNKAHFWRFNPNRLRHLIQDYRLKDPSFRR